MSHKGKVQFTLFIIAPPEKEAEGDRLFASHAKWMEETHYREGDKALVRYNVSKGPDEKGNICFILTEVYETNAGITDHLEQAHASWKDIDAFHTWTSECTTTGVDHASVIHSLW